MTFFMHSNMPDRENKTKTTIQVFDYVIKLSTYVHILSSYLFKFLSPNTSDNGESVFIDVSVDNTSQTYLMVN